MSRRPSVQTSKASSAFSDILKSHHQAHGEATAEAVPEPSRPLAKSKDPAYVKLTSYIRKDTYLAAKRRMLDAGGGQISDVVEELLATWVRGG